MSTAVISDLHLGSRTKSDLLRRPEALGALTAELEDVDQLVLLGDVIELREGPVGPALADSRAVLGELGRAFAGRRVVIVPGNHDHRLAEDWLERRRLDRAADELALEQLSAPEAGDVLELVARAMAPAEVALAYPGLWLRPDVYATHGHYLDCHNSVPTLECIAASVTDRLNGRRLGGRPRPGDYEAALAPTYAFTYNVAQAAPDGRSIVGSDMSVRLWQRLSGGGVRRNIEAFLLGGVLLPGALAAVNALGLGPFSADLSAVELRRAALRSMSEVVERLGIEAAYVIFGHTHRAGPYEDDDEGWRLPGGGRLINSGSWLYEPAFLGAAPQESPYWPGTCVLVPDAGPPVLRRLLDELSPS